MTGRTGEPPLTPTVVPAQLPSVTAGFSGRDAQLARLDELAFADDTSPVVVAITGTAGVGKTALALHWAHRNRKNFPHGQLYVNLRGYDAAQPRRGADVLAEFLWALGIRGSDIPQHADQRTALYRSLLAERRMLVVLDNAANPSQVRDLLPGAGASAVLVTSRDSLAGLVARDGAYRIDVDLLDRDDAVGLLRRLVGRASDDATLERLAALCAHLPLALRVAAELATVRHQVPLAELVDRLADDRSRISALNAGGDDDTGIGDVFTWSYRYLSPAAARLFRLLGLSPSFTVDTHAAAALAGEQTQTTVELLDELERAHLVQQVSPGHVTMHDLLRSYAADLAVRRDDPADRRHGLSRLFDFYCDAASAAGTLLHPHDSQVWQPRRSMVGLFGNRDDALEWLDGERDALAAAILHMARYGSPSQAAVLLTTISRYLQLGRAPFDLIGLSSTVIEAAQEAHDRRAEALAQTQLGIGHALNVRFESAGQVFRRALELARLTGQQDVEAVALLQLGIVSLRLERRELSVDFFVQALACDWKRQDTAAEARTLGYLAFALQKTNRLEDAIRHFRESIALAHRIGDDSIQARSLNMLGAVYHRQHRIDLTIETLRRAKELAYGAGDLTVVMQAGQNLGFLLTEHYPDDALSELEEGLSLARNANDRVHQARMLHDLGRLYRRQGDPASARDHFERSRDLCVQLGHMLGESRARNGVAEVQLDENRPHDAVTGHTEAMRLATHFGDDFEQARAHHGLGLAWLAIGETATAREHLATAERMFDTLGEPIAAAIKDTLATLPP